MGREVALSVGSMDVRGVERPKRIVKQASRSLC
jgi:hypothetical protein